MIRIVFQGGATVDLKTDGEFTVEKSKLTNELRALTWNGVEPKPMYLNLNEIVAVLEIEETPA